jgi:5-methyltetrahydrofolate--homocysteine methyltransferase
MQRRGMDLPLLIGGATTSPLHTALRISPEYDQPVTYVKDASRAVGVVSKLLNPDQRDEFIAQIANDQDKQRERHAGRSETKSYVDLETARANALQWDPRELRPVQPACTGVIPVEDVTVADLRPYIDWTPFLHTWQIKASYPKVLDDPAKGEAARNLLADAERMLDRIESEGWLHPRGVAGIFPAGAMGDDVAVYADEPRQAVRMRVHFLRQQTERPEGKPNLCLSDYVAPADSGVPDWIGAFAVTAGRETAEHVQRFEAAGDDYNAIMVEALADRLAEAFAEYLHQRVRREWWGYDPAEALGNEDLIAERYRGIRPAPGYPACPEHTEKALIWQLLDVETHTGMRLTESFAMDPGASVSGFYLAHPEARYFGLGRIQRDQVIDYAERKGWSIEEAETWLAPSLAYDPDEAPAEALSRAG